MLDSCPLVRSLGQLVEGGTPFIWLPGKLPYLGCNSQSVQIVAQTTKIEVADRVGDHVPIFAEITQFNDASYGLAAAVAEPDAAADPVPEIRGDHADADSE